MPSPGTLLWTALPRGRSGTRLQLSVLLSPRLTVPPSVADNTVGGGALAEFGDWPATARGLRFSVALDAGSGTTPIRIGDIAPDAGVPDSTLWAALMRPLTVAPVRPVRDAPAQVVSYATRPNYTAIVAGYRPDPSEQLAVPAAAAPTASARDSARRRVLALVAPTEAERRLVTAERQRLAAGAGTSALQRLAAASTIPAAQLFFDQAGDYFDQLNQGARDRAYAPPAPPPVHDFHDAITVYSRYPWLMRSLGLVFDIEVDLGTTIASLPASGRVFVLATGTTSAWQQVSPRTWFQLGSDTFSARPDPGSSNGSAPLGIEAGLLAARVDDTPMALDLDPLIHGLRAAALRYHATASSAAPPPLPAPRTAGLALARSGVDSMIASMLASQKRLDDAIAGGADGSAMELNAEDLMRGFRVDIRLTGTTGWRSLHQRQGRYRLADGSALATVNDEGCAALRAFNPAGDASAVWTHETLFRWIGWSLSAPRPGRTIGPDGQLIDGSGSDGSNLPLRVSFVPQPGSLPRLRFGQNYECRLRVVDLAGNAIPPEADTDGIAAALPLGPYYRFDPLLAPALRMRDATQPAESVDLVVLRSALDAPAAGDAERWVAPPRASAQMAEWHGMLDEAGGVDPGAYATLVTHDGSLGDAPYGASPPALPYLPDPFARGVWWLDDIDVPPAIPGPPAAMLPFTGTWPALEGLRVRLVEGAAAPNWDAAARVLTIALAKGQQHSWRLASAPDVGSFSPTDRSAAGDLAVLDTWGALWDDPQSKLYARRQSQWNLIASGRDDQVTPYHRITFVHAIPQPLLRPVLDEQRLLPSRPFFATNAVFGAITPLDIASTGHVELLGQWSDPVDNGVDPPSRIAFATQLGRVSLAAATPQPPGDVVVSFMHEFRDTRHHRVSCSMVAATRYREFFPEITDPAQLTQTSATVTVDVPASAPPARPKVLAVLPIYAFDDVAPGATLAPRRRTGLRVVLDRPWYSSGDDERLGVVMPIKVIPNPQFDTGPGPTPGPVPGPGPRPSAPVGPGGNGGGVVLVDDPPLGIENALVSIVTQWGIDPVLPGGRLGSPFAPLPRHFANVRDKAFLFSVANVDGGEVFNWDRVVASFDVQFAPPDPVEPQRPADATRDPNDGRWICDLELHAGGDAGVPYAPFVRLALVRFQPFAPDRATVLAPSSQMPADHADYNGDMRVSDVVLADFVQLAPQRSVSMVADANDATRLTVAVSGPGYTARPDASDETQRPPAVLAVDAQVDLGDAGAPLWVTLASTESSAIPLPGQPGLVQWSTTITLPFARGSRAQRLLLREYECVPGDAGADITRMALVRRLVYSDLLAL